MTLAEILLVLAVGIFVLKPDDIKAIAKSIKNILSYINQLKNEIFTSIDDESTISRKDQEKINNYLVKIIQLSGKYEGDYNLSAVKAYYHRLLLDPRLREDDKNPKLDN